MTERNNDRDALLALEMYTQEQWYPWVIDMLDTGYAYPQYLLSDPMADGLHDIHLHFELHGFSSKEYQKALLKVLLERVSNQSPIGKQERVIERLIIALKGARKMHNVERLVEIFNSPNYQSTKIARDEMLKPEILQMLSRCELTEKTRDDLEEEARILLPGYLTDVMYCSGLLRFSHRQYPTFPAKFFANFILILGSIKTTQISHDMKVMLADKLDEYKFHNKEQFPEIFPKWLPLLQAAPHSAEFKECFESL